MLERWQPFTASLILGLIWGIWHLPTFFIAGLPQNCTALPVFFLNTISLSVADTRLFLCARGNLLPPILVHLITDQYSRLLHISFSSLRRWCSPGCGRRGAVGREASLLGAREPQRDASRKFLNSWMGRCILCAA